MQHPNLLKACDAADEAVVELSMKRFGTTHGTGRSSAETWGTLLYPGLASKCIPAPNPSHKKPAVILTAAPRACSPSSGSGGLCRWSKMMARDVSSTLGSHTGAGSWRFTARRRSSDASPFPAGSGFWAGGAQHSSRCRFVWHVSHRWGPHSVLAHKLSSRQVLECRVRTDTREFSDKGGHGLAWHGKRPWGSNLLFTTIAACCWRYTSIPISGAAVRTTSKAFALGRAIGWLGRDSRLATGFSDRVSMPANTYCSAWGLQHQASMTPLAGQTPTATGAQVLIPRDKRRNPLCQPALSDPERLKRAHRWKQRSDSVPLTTSK